MMKEKLMKNDDMEKLMLVRSDDCPLSELATRIKGIVETAQDSEYSSFKLLPYRYDLEEKYLGILGKEKDLKEMIYSLSANISLEQRECLTGLWSGYSEMYGSLDLMIKQLQKEEQKLANREKIEAKDMKKTHERNGDKESIKDKLRETLINSAFLV